MVLHQCGKWFKTKSQNVSRTNSNAWRGYRNKTDRMWGWVFVPYPTLNRVDCNLLRSKTSISGIFYKRKTLLAIWISNIFLCLSKGCLGMI